MTDCLFCNIAEKKLPATIVHEDEQIVAFRDIVPQAPTHILIIPKRHIVSLNSMEPQDVPLLGHMIYTAKQLATQHNVDDDGFRLVINTNEHGGQTVYHIHLHLLAGRHLAWPPG